MQPESPLTRQGIRRFLPRLLRRRLRENEVIQPTTYSVIVLEMSTEAPTSQICPNASHLKRISYRRSFQGPFTPVALRHRRETSRKGANRERLKEK